MPELYADGGGVSRVAVETPALKGTLRNGTKT